MTYPIPAKALESHIAILGKTGSGKTWAAKGLIEAALEREERACIIDPVGVWYGLRTSASGKGAGYPVVIFGGEHGDFPLAGPHGEAVAEIVGGSTTPVIVDTSAMRVRDRTQFMTDFSDAILRKNRGPLHLVMDEAHLFAPQGKVNDPQSGVMLHAVNNMVSLGRARGLRIVLISQRPAKLHKDALTQTETLVAMRLIWPQDRRAVEDWIKDNADADKAKEILSSLAGLKTGHGWLWAPELGVLEQVHFPKLRTLDTSAAPGQGAGPSTVMAPIDREAITAKLGAIAKETVANDPARLRARISELERGLKAKQDEMSAAGGDKAYKAGYNTGHMHGHAAGLQAAFGQFKDLRAAAVTALRRQIDDLGEHFIKALKNAPVPDLPQWQATVSVADQARLDNLEHARAVRSVRAFEGAPLRDSRKATHQVRETIRRGNGAGGAKLPKAERSILTALAQYEQGRTKVQVALLTGYAHSGGGFNNALGALRSRSLIEDVGGLLRITNVGRQELGDFDPLPVGQDLLALWRRQLGKAERGALEALVDAYPGTLTKEEVAAAAGYEATGGGFNNALGRLRTLELISGPGYELKASEDLF